MTTSNISLWLPAISGAANDAEVTLRLAEIVLPLMLLVVVMAWAMCGFVMWLNGASFESRARRFRQRLK